MILRAHARSAGTSTCRSSPIWSLAYARLFVDPTPRVPILFNWTPSLPYRVALAASRAARRCSAATSSSSRSPARPRTDYPGLQRQPFFKIVRGLPGDTVTVVGRARWPSTAKYVGAGQDPCLRPPAARPDRAHRDPAGLTTTCRARSADSFDSRYRGQRPGPARAGARRRACRCSEETAMLSLRPPRRLGCCAMLSIAGPEPRPAPHARRPPAGLIEGDTADGRRTYRPCWPRSRPAAEDGARGLPGGFRSSAAAGPADRRTAPRHGRRRAAIRR
ncbi:MAG: hypothetical protein MZW92_45055 [Comamonadaceae bacterium]|nr:hypothetical protein [Comamonadaceae bacterium]